MAPCMLPRRGAPYHRVTCPRPLAPTYACTSSLVALLVVSATLRAYIYTTASISPPHDRNSTGLTDREARASAMGKRGASMLLMLSLEAMLLVAGLSSAAAAAAGDDTADAIIRLPSDTETGMAAAASDDDKRPWECCDLQPCTRSIPAMCRCHDMLDKCSDACKECGKVSDSDPPRYICKDVYIGVPAPMCHKDQQAGRDAGPKEMAVVMRGSKKGRNGEERPWKCCDKAVPGPTTKGKVVWYCMDKVDKCTCDRCLALEGTHSYYCLDGYKGSDPGPSCTTQA
ncbi:unnamed protein product [Urochloa humidicola]